MSWFIKVRDMVYGPYSLEKITKFAGEGRISLKTMVSKSRESDYYPASDDHELLEVLEKSAQKTNTISNNSTSQTKQNTRALIIHTKLSDNIHLEFFSLLRQYGDPIQPMPEVWMLRADISADRLRNELSRELGAQDSLLIFEVQPDQAAWFNVGEDVDRQLRSYLAS